jgi:hypothetical protein
VPRVGWIFAGFLVVGAFLMLTENRTQRVRYSLLAPAAGLHVHALVHASRPRDFAKLPKAKELSGNATILPILEMLVVVVPQAAFAGAVAISRAPLKQLQRSREDFFKVSTG